MCTSVNSLYVAQVTELQCIIPGLHVMKEPVFQQSSLTQSRQLEMDDRDHQICFQQVCFADHQSVSSKSSSSSFSPFGW